LIILKITLIID